jgi:hypothetical protein
MIEALHSVGISRWEVHYGEFIGLFHPFSRDFLYHFLAISKGRGDTGPLTNEHDRINFSSPVE